MNKNELLKKCWIDIKKRKPVLSEEYTILVYNKKTDRVQTVSSLMFLENKDVTHYIKLPFP
jgi:hypothetical protein